MHGAEKPLFAVLSSIKSHITKFEIKDFNNCDSQMTYSDDRK